MTTDIPEFIHAVLETDDPIDDDEDHRIAAMRLVDDEIDIFPPDRDYLEHLPWSSKSRTFSTPLLDLEHNAIENNEHRCPSSDLSAFRCDVPEPVKIGSETVEEADTWDKSLNQLKIRLEYGLKQLTNIELMKSYGSLAWEHCSKETELIETALKSCSTHLKKKLTRELDWKKESDKQRIAKQVMALQNEWDHLEKRTQSLSETMKKL